MRRHRTIALSTTLALCISILPPAENASAAVATDWNRKVKIVIQNSQVDATLTNFPVLLTKDNLPSEACDADGTYPAQNGGGDIRFTSDENGNTQLPLEVVNFTTDNDPANCAVEMWVQVPSVSSSTGTVLWMWYNTDTSDDQPAANTTYGSQNVWTNGYEGVWHLNQTSGTRTEASANENDLDDVNTVASTAGSVGTAADFERGNSELLRVYNANQSGLNVAGDFSASAWVQFESLPGTNEDYGIFGKYGSTSSMQEYFFIYQDFNGTKRFRLLYSDGSNITELFHNYTPTTGIPYHISFSVDVSAKTADIWINGTKSAMTQGTANATNMQSGIGDFAIGDRYPGQGQYFDGVIDEVKIATGIQADAWHDAEYNNTSSPSTFAIEQTPVEASSAPNETTIRKAADENVSSSATLQNDDDFAFTLEPNTEYVLNAGFFARSSSATPDLKIAFSVPAGTTMDIGYLSQGGNTRRAGLLETSGSASDTIAVPANTDTIVQTFGTIVTSSTGGTLNFKWAQVNSNANAMTIKQGSFMSVVEIAE